MRLLVLLLFVYLLVIEAKFLDDMMGDEHDDHGDADDVS